MNTTINVHAAVNFALQIGKCNYWYFPVIESNKAGINFHSNNIAEELGSESKSFYFKGVYDLSLILNINLKEYLHVICNSFYILWLIKFKWWLDKDSKKTQ